MAIEAQLKLYNVTQPPYICCSGRGLGQALGIQESARSIIQNPVLVLLVINGHQRGSVPGFLVEIRSVLPALIILAAKQLLQNMMLF